MKGFIPKPFRESELFAGIAAGLGLKAVSVKNDFSASGSRKRKIC
jgi:hypothetical protein